MLITETMAGPRAAHAHPCHAAPSWAEARRLAYECAGPLPPVWVPLADADGRVLNRDVAALQDLPHYASSAMDGWAVNGAGPWLLPDPQQPPAHPDLAAYGRLAPNHARVIATGGLVPAGAEAILRKESGEVVPGHSGSLLLTVGPGARADEPRRGQHIRPAGEEALAGDVLLPAGTVLNPARIALAAVAGHDEVQVRARPSVAVVLTGSEVVTQGVPAAGEVRDTFGPQLGTVLSQLGGIAGGPVRIGDSFSEWLSALDTATAPGGGKADVVITTGGTGRSGTDHFRAAIGSLGGRILLDGIAMRPGHPAVLAELPDGRFVAGLPGNPLAAMMALLTVGAPLIAALGGRPLPAATDVLSGSDMPPDPGRTRLVPCRLLSGLAFPVQHTGPGMMRGLAWAEGVMVVPPDGVDSGQPVPVLPLPWSPGVDMVPGTNPQGRSIP